MNQREIDKILKDNKEIFDALGEYDKTGKLPKISKKDKKKVK